MRGRKATPTKLKVLLGNPGRRPIRTDEPEPKPGPLTMPKWLEEFPVAVEEWEKEADVLAGMGVLTKADLNVLAMRCYLASQIQEMAHDIKKEGRVSYTIKMDSLGNEVADAKPNPKTIQIKNAITEYRQLGSLLGLDPSGRTHLSIEAGEKKNKFDGLIGAKVGKK